MATVDGLKQALKAGINMALTYEPTFFGRQDGLSTVFVAKNFRRSCATVASILLRSASELVSLFAKAPVFSPFC